MQALISFASSILEPSSNNTQQQQQQQQQQDYKVPMMTSSSSTTKSVHRSGMNLSDYNNNNNNNNNNMNINDKTPAQLGEGLAIILKTFMEFLPAGIRELQPQLTNPFRLFCDQPPLTLEAFGQRLSTYFACSPVCFYVAAVYLERAWAAHPEVFEPLSVYKLMLVALTIAVKFCEDRTSSQVHYARCGGIEVSELNALESLFLQSMLQFRAFVNEDELQVACFTLDKYCAISQNLNNNTNNSIVNTDNTNTKQSGGLRKTSHSSF